MNLKPLKLINFIFMGTLKYGLLLFPAMAVIQCLSFGFVLNRTGSGQINFEYILLKAGFSTTFIIFNILVLIAFTASILKYFSRSMSIYALMNLPLKSHWLFLSFFISGVTMVLLLWVVQFGSIFLNYYIYSLRFENQAFMLQNGLFLSFIRYDFLRIFFPLRAFEVFRSIMLIVSPVCAVLYFTTCLRSEELKKLLLLLVWAVAFWLLTGGERFKELAFWWDYLSIATLAGLTIYFFVAGLYYVKTKAIS